MKTAALLKRWKQRVCYIFTFNKEIHSEGMEPGDRRRPMCCIG